MKKYFLLGCLIFTSTFLNRYFSQLPESTKFKYFEHFSKIQRDLIKDNWNEFFKKELSSNLGLANCYSIYFDSYGCLYPNLDLFKNLENIDFENSKVSEKDLRKYSLAQFFQNDFTRNQFLQNQPSDADKQKYEAIFRKYYILNSSTVRNLKETKEFPAEKIDEFCDEWDRLQDDIVVKELINRLEGKTRILFFVHGFNVPQSLATIQAQRVYEVLDSLGLEMESTLFVPIYWPSGNGKDKEFGDEDLWQKLHSLETQCKNGNYCEEYLNTYLKLAGQFSIRNHQGLFDGGRTNMLKSSRYSKNAYYTAIKLRSIINKLDSNLEILVYSHSMGATIATTTVINTLSKVSTPQDNTDFYDELKKEFDKIPIPKQPMKIFLSAPGIPGVSTFEDINGPTSYKNKWFFTTYNHKDPILNKQMNYLAHETKIVSAENHGATTLGCDYGGEVYKVSLLFKAKSLSGHFVPKEVTLDDHDLFLYLEQEEYLKLLQLFIQ